VSTGPTRDRRRRWLGLLVGLSAVFVDPAAAHEKTDIVVLENGDRFQGEIKKLVQGTLTLKTDAAGTISVKWTHVARVVSTYEFEVHATSGERFYGTLAEPDRAGELKVLSPSGSHTLDLNDVFWLMEIEQGFWNRINGSVDFGFSYVQSTEAVQYSLSAEAHYKTRKIGGDLRVNSLFNTQEDAESASQQNLSFVLFRPLGAFEGRANLFGIGQLQSNPNQGFDLRSVAGGGVGVFLREASGGFILLSGGVVADREQVTGSPEVNTNAEALVGLRLANYRSDFPRRRISLGVNTFTNLTNSPRFRAQIDLKISWEIIRHLIVSLNFLDNYDSRPPTEDAAKNDLSVTTSLGYTF
jgi:hypothetical protein